MAKSHISNRACGVSTLQAMKYMKVDTLEALFDICDLAIFYSILLF